jgi:O-succinylbenzoic acid--CoA ligase
VEVRIVDEAIEVQGATRMSGLLGEPPLPADAWLRTGDAGRLDEDGHLHVLGRLDDRIVTGGENVDPSAVEEALSSHPRVAAACVVGIADATWGQRVAALVVPAGEPPSLEQLRAHLADRLASFAHPRALRIVDALPLTAAGKLDRRAARALLEA